VADGIHSLSDVATDLVVILGVRFGSIRPDRKHPYGHGRMETFAAGIVAAVLIILGLGMIWRSAVSVASGKIARPGWAVLVVALISIVAKELLYKVTRKVAIKTNSSSLYANAWHHRSDALSSIAVFIGVLTIRFGFSYGDQLAAIAVGIMIILVGIKVLGNCFRELAESAIDSGTVEQIKNIIVAEQRIRSFHKLRTRTVGRELFLDLHILVDPVLTITDAHEISESLETSITRQLTIPVNITVHIEPDLPGLRRESTDEFKSE